MTTETFAKAQETPLPAEDGKPRGFWANLPRGAKLSEEGFLSRHR